MDIKPERKSLISFKNLMIFSSLAFCFVTMVIFIFFEANSLVDFGNSFYGAATAMAIFIITSSNTLKSTKIFDLFARLEEFIKKRVFHCCVLSNSVKI